ncbi:MAG: biliverdin-producing heme oxygenase [Xanthobacteraceae bacterium]|nr:biliverdin-producing heme oxygenase [Xanthobacteraceae bacterium]
MIHDLIRQATHTSHRRLDLALSWLDLGKPRYYAGFLRGQAEALLPIETALDHGGIDRLLPDWKQRARTKALEHDLAVMDVSCDPLPMPRFINDAQMLGAVYVLEASRMGARVMLARLAQYPDSCSIGATKYLKHGFGNRCWPTFLDVLEHHPAALGDPAAVVQGAEIAFGMFESALIPVASLAAE